MNAEVPLMKQITHSQPRRQIANLSIIGTTQLHLRSPWVIAWWSAAFPGMGHLLLSKYLRGYMLFIWEIVINLASHINVAILYTFTGQFEEAKEVLDERWLLLYLPTYLFAIWDSYRSTVDINHKYTLAAREDAEIKPFVISGVEINYLNKRSPWVSAVWSILMPGTGQFYIHRLTVTFLLLIWWVVSAYLSNILPAIHYTLLGEFSKATMILDPQWFLNIPSLYFFCIYDAYSNTVENNKLFDWEQSKFLNRDYQNPFFQLPFMNTMNGSGNMYVVSTFMHSEYLELAITAIQMKGIAKESILAVPLDKRGEQRKLFDSLQSADGLSLLDLPLILATLFSLFGAVYGFVLPWGPIIWGLIGIFSGFIVGLAIKLFITWKFTPNRQKNSKTSEVVVIVSCNKNQLEMIKDTFWENHALGVRKLDLSKNIG